MVSGDEGKLYAAIVCGVMEPLRQQWDEIELELKHEFLSEVNGSNRISATPFSAKQRLSVFVDRCNLILLVASDRQVGILKSLARTNYALGSASTRSSVCTSDDRG